MTHKVAFVIGSKSDYKHVEPYLPIAHQLGLHCELRVLSAHRTPTELETFLKQVNEDESFKAVIAGAGMAAHLPGVVASKTLLPVIGVPMPSPDLNSLDSLLSIAQMPGGIPVATMSIGKAGVKNAFVFVAHILAHNDPVIKQKLIAFRKEQSQKVLEDNASVQ